MKMNKKLDKSSSTGKVTFKKQLVRNPTKTNTKAVVIRESEKVEPLNLNDLRSSSEPNSSRIRSTTGKKTTFNLPDVDSSMKSLSINSKSKCSSKTNLFDKDSNSSEKNTNFDTPGVNSSLNLSKKIDSLGKVKTTTIKETVGKRAFDEKVIIDYTFVSINIFKLLPEKIQTNTKIRFQVTRQVNFPYEKKIFKNLMPLSSPNKHFPTKVISSREPLPPKDKEPSLEDFIEQKSIPEYAYVPNFKLENRKSRAHCNNLQLYKVLQFLEKS